MTKSAHILSWLGVPVILGVGTLWAAPPIDNPLAPSESTSQFSDSNATTQISMKSRKSLRGAQQPIVSPKDSQRPALRSGVDVTPPKIDRLTPAPGQWITGNLGLREIQIGFNEPVTIPAGAITIWTVGAGAVTGFTTSYDSTTNMLTVSFASPIRDDRLTLVVDYSITDVAGNELDGEIADPMSATLPSGDGVRGGQAVFRINILQGDANRDGVVDTADAAIIVATLGLCNNDAGFDPRADFSLDGCVNAQDVAIFKQQTVGKSLPATDGAPPIVIEVIDGNGVPLAGDGILTDVNTVLVVFSEIMLPQRFTTQTCFVVDENGNIRVPISFDLSVFGDLVTYIFTPPLPQCGTYTINISNSIADQSGELLVVPSTPPVVTGLIPPPAPVLITHTTLTTANSVTITGSAPGATLVEVSAPALPIGDPKRLFTVPLTNDAFTADVTLSPDSNNPIFFTALSTCSDVRSSPVMTSVTHDTQSPEIFIDFPTGGAQITTATTDVAGRVGDMLSGFMGLTVTVNGNPAIVDVGIGNNGTFFMQSVPIGAIDQPTTITAVATDVLGNTLSRQITVTRVAITASTSQMAVFSGNSQSGQVLTPLFSPIVVKLFDTDGTTLFVNKVVTFKVTRSDGRLGATAAEITPNTDPNSPSYNPDPGVMMYQVRTDASGEARAYWRMGHDAGCGNNRVEATSTSVEGTVAFCASALAATASQLNIGSGNNQRAEAGGPAPEPLRVWVSDGQNPAITQNVLFTVTSGGGLVNGQPTATVTTDMTGHAEVSFTLGPDQGNNVVEATLVSNSMLQPAQFVTFGVLRDETMPTSFTGVVLNNASQPIGGAACTLTVGATALPSVISDVNGRFAFDNLLVAGPARLFVDGSTATTVNGQAVMAGTYPSLPFEPVIIPNAVNTLPTPVLLPPLETTGKVFDNTQDITLTLTGLDGLEMLIRVGTTVTKADGTVVNAGNPITLVLSQVHADDIPMPIPDGASPPFAWTLQPSGTTFNPPIEITYPNMSGLPAGSIAYFLSFNHATSRFEIVATGHVTDDGSQILSDPGAGLTVAGWGCNCPPYSVTGDCCSGCNDTCCEGPCCCDTCCPAGGSCCNDECCTGPCCSDVCCAAGNVCCGGVCCDGTCINDVCCDGPTCGGKCCSGSASCCGGECCEGDCCEGVCCPAGGSCCDGKCCEGLCCDGTCCGSDVQSCCAGSCCAGACCEATGMCCPAGKESCCNDTCCDGPCCNGTCCASGDSCCGDLCCSPGETCCGGICCAAGQTCLNGVCCDGPNCGGQCCPPGSEGCCNNACCAGPCCNDVCCSSGESCCGAAGCCPMGQTCCGDAGCCPDTAVCCEATGGGCCPQGTTCCGEECCPVGIACCDGACCPAGQECCGGDTCCDSDKCCGDTCCAANETCCNGMCELGSCSLSVQQGEGCPGSTVELTLTADCDPDCDTMSFSLNSSVQYLTVNLPGPISCAGPAQQLTFTVDIDSDAPTGPITFPIIGTTDAAQCSTSVTVTVKNVDLIFDGLAEDKEESPGGLICVNNDDDDNSVRADKDDDPGAILNENDLKTLVLSLNGLDPSGSGMLSIIQGSGGQVNLYQNSDRSMPVTLPVMYLGSDLPVTLFVEGYQASSSPQDVTLEFEYSILSGDTCKDKVNVSVGGVEFEAPNSNEFTGSIHRKMDLINLLNPNPIVQFDMDPLPSTGAPIVFPVSGMVTSRIAPLTMQDVTINDQPVQSLQLISSGTAGLGPFVHSFSRNITLPDHDLLIKAQATSALGNSGTHKLAVIANFDCQLGINPVSCPGTFLSRNTRVEPFTPVGVGNVEWFTVAVVDPFAIGSVVSVQISTGVELRTLQLFREPGTIRFKQDYLHLVPENLNLPIGTAQEIINTRFKGKLGSPVRATYTLSDGSLCEDNAITVGIMFVAANGGQPVDVVLAGLPKDVVDNGINRNPLNMIAGLPGDAPEVTLDASGAFKLEPQLIARDYRDDPDPKAPITTTSVNLFRASDDPKSPAYNLFQSDIAKPLLPLVSEVALAPVNPNLELRNVHAGGFLRLEDRYEFGVLQAVEPIRGPIVVNILVDGLGSGFPQASFAPAVPPNFETMLADGSLPNFAKLVGDNAHSVKHFDGQTTFPSITFSAWSSWVTGKDPGIHGVTGSNFYRRDPVNDLFWGGSSEMDIPVDHVSFHGIAYPIADNDIVNVWSSLGTLNSAIRPDVATLTGRPNVFTIYQALATRGINSAVVYHFPYRGAVNTELPSAFAGLIDHADSMGAGLDDGTNVELKDLMDPPPPDPNAMPPIPPHIRPPQVLTVYYAGLDTNVHNNSNYPAVGATHLVTTDRYLGTLVRLLEQWNLMDEAMFTFTGDHGLTDVVRDDTHSLLIETFGDKELEDVFDALSLDVLDTADPTFECDPVCGFNAVVTLNGGMAHIYLRDSVTNDWAEPPNYVQDVLPVALRFYDNTIGRVVDEAELVNSIELILVRDSSGAMGFNGPYLVAFRSGISKGSFTTLPLTSALNFSINNIPLIPSGYVDFIANIQKLQDIRSGDIILLSNYSKKHSNLISPIEEGDSLDRDGGYYFGGELDSWHGSLYDTDMTIPIVFSCPRCGSNATTQFLNTVNTSLPLAPAKARISNIVPTLFKALTGEDLP